MAASIGSDAYADWVQEKVDEGWEPWFATFMFDQLPGSQAAQVQQMLMCAERAYALRITRVLKHPLNRSNRDRRPIWLAAPDLPIFRRIKKQLWISLANDGLHIHIIILEPPERDPLGCVAEHMWARQQQYRGRCPGLARIDVRAITHDIPEVVSYLFKQLSQREGQGHGISGDDVLILPRTNDEVRGTSGWVGRNSSIFASF